MKSLEIITIGDEVLMGQVVNTNAAYIGRRLTESGMEAGWMTTIGDNRQQILHALRRANARADGVIITGGLGPTPDDLTKPVLAEFFRDRLELREHLLENVRRRFEERGVEMPESNLSQAEFPRRAKEIPNPYGTAVGIHYKRGEKEWFALPGVPAEMKRMMEDYVLPRLQETGFAGKVKVRVLRTAGIGESNLMDLLQRFDEAASLVEVAFLPREYGVDVKLTARGDDESLLEDRIRQAEDLLLPDLAEHLFGRDRETLPEAVGKLARAKGVRIAVAESCTGGLISKLFTDIPGSSDYFERGVVTYSNRSKTDLLGVPAEMIERRGAVSEEVAAAMAQGLLRRSAADLTASVTGIAGPGGGTEEKPVGLVYIGIADKEHLEVHRFRFLFERDLNRKRTAMTALKLLYDRIKNLDFDG